MPVLSRLCKEELSGPSLWHCINANYKSERKGLGSLPKVAQLISGI